MRQITYQTVLLLALGGLVLGGCLDQDDSEGTTNTPSASLTAALAQEDCAILCRERTQVLLSVCIESGVAFDVCEDRAAQFETTCVQDGCGGEDGSCERQCDAQAHDDLDVCLESNNDVDACADSALMARDVCLDSNCVVSDEECRDACRDDAHTSFDACLDDGQPFDTCIRLIREEYGTCVENGCMGHEEGTCDERCQDGALDALNTCLDDGGAFGSCSDLSRETYNACFEDQCVEEDPCLLACRAHAIDFLHLCLDWRDAFESCSEGSVEDYSMCAERVCGVEAEPDSAPEDLCEAGKPSALGLVYTGDDCSATSHSQSNDKVSCDDRGALPNRVWIVVSDHEDGHHEHHTKVWFEGEVALDALFEIQASNAGENKLKSKTFVTIHDLDRNVLQEIEFHTSCSQSLFRNNQFGAIRVRTSTPER